MAADNTLKPFVFIACSTEGLDLAYKVHAELEFDAEVTIWPQNVFKPGEFTVEGLFRELHRCDFGMGVPSFCRSYHGLDRESSAGPEGLEVAVEPGDPQRQDMKKAWRLPAHAGALEATLNDMLARPLHRTGSHRKPTVPGFLVADPGPVVLHIADQLGQRGADSFFPGPQPLERTQDLPNAVRQQRADFLLHPRFGPRRVVGVQQMG